MLGPDVRTVAMDLLRPSPGYELDLAILTTYTLDLEAMLALPFAVMAHSDGGLDTLLDDPLLLLQGLREAGERIHVFVDETGIAAPQSQRGLYATLEQSVHPVRATGGGVFHPKVWLARFVSREDGTHVVLRVAILSRNLTFDRSWDVALASEARPRGRRVAASGALGRLVGDLASLSSMQLPQGLPARLRGLSAEVWRCSFPAPEEFSDPIQFHAMGLARSRRWRPKVSNGRKVLAVAPFVRASVLDDVRNLATGEGLLISRPDELAGVSPDTLARWTDVRVLADTFEEDDDEVNTRPSGLHAKLLAVEHGWDVTWFIGSANLTRAALDGRNVEVMAEITGRKRRVGIEQFRDGFDVLCASYNSSETDDASESQQHDAEELLDEAVRVLVASALRIQCKASGDLWKWCLEGAVTVPNGVDAEVWPVSIDDDQARALAPPMSVTLPKSKLTAFAGFRLATTESAVNEERRIALKLPMTGAPPDRAAEILRSLIDSPERLMAFLRTLLASVGELGQFGNGEGAWVDGAWGEAFEDEMLLEDMLRTASTDPGRLATIRRLVSDLQKTMEGRQIVPETLLGVWQAVEAALATCGGEHDR